jgi:cytochrome b
VKPEDREASVSDSDEAGRHGARSRKVWDIPTRAFHWLLVVSIIASWATAEIGDGAYMRFHLWLGYWTGGLILFRIIWGVIGTRHARFASFLKGPRAFLGYAASLTGKRHVEAPGHNPMGGWMVALMLALVAAQVGTGLFADDDIVWSGPWSHTVSGALSSSLTSWHHTIFSAIQIAVLLHLCAIGYYGFVLRNNLVGPMVTGAKAADRIGEADAIAGTPWARTLIAAVLAAGIATATVQLAPPRPAESYGDW